MAVSVKYKKEFFDRDYSTWEAYKRVWKYAKKYKFRLTVGILCGMLTAGTLVPFFQIIQPALQHAESHDSALIAEVAEKPTQAGSAAEVEAAVKPAPKKHKAKGNAFDKEIARHAKLPAWYPKVEKWAAKCGISL